MKKLLALIALVAVLGVSGIAAAETVTLGTTVGTTFYLDVDCDGNATYDEVGVDDAETLYQPGGTSNPAGYDGTAFADGECVFRISSNSAAWEFNGNGSAAYTGGSGIAAVGVDCVIDNAAGPGYTATEEVNGFKLSAVSAAPVDMTAFVESDTTCTVAKDFNDATAYHAFTGSDLELLKSGTAVELQTLQVDFGVGVTETTPAATYNNTTTWTLKAND